MVPLIGSSSSAEGDPLPRVQDGSGPLRELSMIRLSQREWVKELVGAKNGLWATLLLKTKLPWPVCEGFAFTVQPEE